MKVMIIKVGNKYELPKAQKWVYFQLNNHLLTCEIKVPSLFLDFINFFDQYWSDFLFPALPLYSAPLALP